jgi:cysteine-rich repeat protein
MLGASACGLSNSQPDNLNIGVGDPMPDAGVPDGGDGGAPDGPGGGEASDVHGVAIDLHVAAPNTATPVPEDLSGFVVQAYVPDDVAGGYRIIPGDTTAGSFTIPAVPAGSYYLLVVAPGDPIPHFYQTASHAIDLGVFALGRVDGPLPVQPTQLTFDLTGTAPAQSGDLFFIDSFATGGEAFGFVPNGGTALDGFVLDWRDTGAVLLDAAEGDDLFVTHQRRNALPQGQATRTILDAFSTRTITLVDGQPTSVTGVFTVPAVSGIQSVQFSPASYLQGHDVPIHQRLSMLFRLRASLTGAFSQGAQLADVSQAINASQQPIFGSVAFNDPYPREWPRFVFVDPQPAWNYAARGTTQSTSYTGNTFTRTPASSFFDFSAPFPAPRGIKLAGVDSSQARAVPFDGSHAVTIEWQPVIGVAHYRVTAMQLTSDGSFATLAPTATFDTLGTSVAMPANLFAVGGSYVFSVASIVDPTTDYAGGTVRRQGFPVAIHDAVTARLLFASSCGNGVVDAPFEQCDSGGVASDSCNADCTRPLCGDGIANTLAHESCDDAGDSMFCNANCTLAACGDGKVHVAAGEQCDDGNLGAFDGCSSDCFVEPGFTCSGEPSVCHFGP